MFIDSKSQPSKIDKIVNVEMWHLRLISISHPVFTYYDHSLLKVPISSFMLLRVKCIGGDSSTNASGMWVDPPLPHLSRKTFSNPQESNVPYIASDS
jgi:hypothetical protein